MNRDQLQKTMNHQMIQEGNLTNMIIKTRQKMSKMGQMTINKRQKGKKLPKCQLSTIAIQENTSWSEKSKTTTRLKERARVTRQYQIDDKCIQIMMILIYGSMNVIEKLPLHMKRLLAARYMEPNC